MSLSGTRSTNSFEQEWLDLIDRHGHTVLSVANPVDEPTDDPPFAYSTGAFESHAAPELIVLGLLHPVGANIINDFMAEWAGGRRFQCGVEERGLLSGDYPIVLLEADPGAGKEYVLRTERFYQGDPYPLWQLIWPAMNGAFPWDEDCPPDVVTWQPNLTGLSWREALERARS
jgi:Domain of unknown function (DUF4262)